MPSPSQLPLLLLLFCLLGCHAQPPAPVEHYKVVARYPHSTSSYTEGFFFLDGLFYEGTGLNGRSGILITQPETGKLLLEVEIPREYFGEGIVAFGSNLYEWTWQSHTGFLYDLKTLRRTGQFTYSGEGWGMTHDASSIITSDGSATIRFRNPADFKETRHILVHDGKDEIALLNELEYIHGEIYANVWHTDRIARISPADGHVIAWIDLSGLLPDALKVDAESVLNGIAYDPAKDRLFVTGKQWPTIFQIQPTP
jgi:glutamine cyclotransferase